MKFTLWSIVCRIEGGTDNYTYKGPSSFFFLLGRVLPFWNFQIPCSCRLLSKKNQRFKGLWIIHESLNFFLFNNQYCWVEWAFSWHGKNYYLEAKRTAYLSTFIFLGWGSSLNKTLSKFSNQWNISAIFRLVYAKYKFWIKPKI